MQISRMYVKIKSMNSFKDYGIKSTNSRNAVMEIIINNKSPLDANEILEGLRKKGLSTDQATVYRILNTFYEKGIVKRIEIGEGKYRYEIEKAHHHHLVCTNCGRIEDIEIDLTEDFDREISIKKGFKVRSHSLEFFGLCKTCQT